MQEKWKKYRSNKRRKYKNIKTEWKKKEERNEKDNIQKRKIDNI